MKTTATFLGSFNPVSLVLGLIAAGLVFAMLSGRKLPLLTSYKPAILLLIVLGMAICTRSGIGRVAAAGAWGHPFAILGYLLGALILLIAVAGLLGLRLPYVSDARAAFIVMAGLIAGKFVVGLLHRLLAAL